MILNSVEFGEICWVELAATDPEKSFEFYSALFGWEIAEGESFDSETPDYVHFTKQGYNIGGMMATSGMGQNMAQCWNIYVRVKDADHTCSLIEQHGGVVEHGPFEIPTAEHSTSRLAITKDPSGARVLLFESDLAFGIKDEVGAPCWFDLVTTDIDAVCEFYEAVFSWKSLSVDFGEGYRVFTMGEKEIAGVSPMPSELATNPSHWGVDFSIANVEEKCQLIEQAGGKVMMAPIDTPFGRTIAALDPWGAGFIAIDRSTSALPPESALPADSAPLAEQAEPERSEK